MHKELWHHKKDIIAAHQIATYVIAALIFLSLMISAFVHFTAKNEPIFFFGAFLAVGTLGVCFAIDSCRITTPPNPILTANISSLVQLGFFLICSITIGSQIVLTITSTAGLIFLISLIALKRVITYFSLSRDSSFGNIPKYHRKFILSKVINGDISSDWHILEGWNNFAVYEPLSEERDQELAASFYSDSLSYKKAAKEIQCSPSFKYTLQG